MRRRRSALLTLPRRRLPVKLSPSGIRESMARVWVRVMDRMAERNDRPWVTVEYERPEPSARFHLSMVAAFSRRNRAPLIEA